MWCMHHLNGCELLGLETGALSVQRSAGECALLFPRKTGTGFFFFFIQTRLIGKFEQHKYIRKNDLKKSVS